mmetsp:Transcript_2717/g.5852  ORF Transcript_2717/g.5852 Transcript_2717/m.5852 type:complete len:129 (+) Transcript_2717:184-570(+)|eukprot:CAMPEP_0171341440 /NCGR_PEP_ID=MMETSP0878-20121228/10187_1 /TAXON_ID=67004 /ORGANISM="Thalassiosira weissflogii, Strain CCMP1336" /LENGTH=128 /DNA_ID=CAMNT_0011843675 /DNA_START=122 /DNA_END=508 /DNA_ORIENTATION=+
MSFKPTDMNFLFEPIIIQDSIPNTPTAQAVPTFIPDGDEFVEEDPSDKAIMVGCGLVGCLIGGPFLAILAALGGSYAAGRDGPIAESSKAVGRIAAVAGKKANEERLICKMKDSVYSLFKKRAPIETA